MRKRIFKAVAALAAFSLAAYLAPKKDKKQGASPVPLGESISYLPEQGGVCRDPVCLFYYRPAQWNESRPVFIAFHGFGRKADRFCRAQTPLWRTRKMFWLSVLNFQRKNIPVPAGIRKLI